MSKVSLHSTDLKGQRVANFALWSAICLVALFSAIMTQGRAIAADPATPHDSGETNTSGCAVCHRTHGGQSNDEFLEQNSIPRAETCFTCHDGSQANSDVLTEYTTDIANVPANREYYSHPAVATGTGHQIPSVDEDTGDVTPVDEFGGMFNRHSDCVDCHNPHSSSSGHGSSMTSAGWTASGALIGASVVNVAHNPTAGGLPSYTFQGRATTSNLEYELCVKCHSGFTIMRSNAGFPKSKWYLDKAVELNPNNLSFHPIAAAGKNQTPKMAANLTGYSPFRVYTLSTMDTISCTQCHANSEDESNAPHAGRNKFILKFPYLERVLRETGESFRASDFQLCFSCHSTVPFESDTDSKTNFPMHYLHTNVFSGSGDPGATIDDPGAGAGHALCSECHFRTHSTAYKTTALQSTSGERLINFAPNVLPYGGVLQWTRTGIGQGTCTLVCHGFAHDATPYPFTL